jgi:thiamine biosynthesis lipoprotein
MLGVYRRPPGPARRAGSCFVAAAACLAAGCAAPHDDAAPVRLTETRRAMGVPWTISVFAPSAPAGRAALAAAFTEIARLDAILSDYDPQSELARLSAASPMESPRRVSPDLWRVLAAAVEYRDASAGGFDPTVGPLTTLWRQARRSGRLPLPEKLAAARRAVGPEALELVPPDAVLLPQAGTRLDLGGIGMGYAADRALEVLARHGIGSALVDASGDVAASGPPPGAAGWRIAVRPQAGPGGGSAPLELAHAAVTTSGDAFQAVEIEGVRYSHIVDPRTGLGVAGRSAVTVVAPDGTTADALATAASVLGPEAGLDLVARRAGCAARFVWEEAGEIRTATTPGWR